jgi:hypothetical protein
MRFIFWLLLSSIQLFSNNTLFLEKVKTMPLLQNSASVIEFEGHAYIVSVGSSHINGTDVQSRINTITIARTLAQKALSNFIHGTQLTVDKYLKKEKTTTTLTIDGQTTTHEVKQKKQYEHIIREKGDGILVNVQELGKWREGNQYYFVLIVKII